MYECHLKSNPVTTRHVSISEPPSRDADSSVHNEPATENVDQQELEQRLQAESKLRVCTKNVTVKCPHGIKGNKFVNGDICMHNHPKRCFKYCKSDSKSSGGCKKGESCSYPPCATIRSKNNVALTNPVPSYTLKAPNKGSYKSSLRKTAS